MPRPGSRLRFAQLDFSATNCSTPFIRSGFKSRGPFGLLSSPGTGTWGDTGQTK